MESRNSDILKPFEELADRATTETPPDIDVRLLVRAALLTAPGKFRDLDWMDVLLRMFRTPFMRFAATLSFVALLLATFANGQAPPVEEVDIVSAFLIHGQ